MRAEEADHIRDQQREAWRAAGPGWDQNRETLREGNRPVTERMLALAGLEPGQRVLDLACGAGDLAGTIARLVGPEGAVLGLDISESMVEAAERYARREGIENAEFRVIDSELDLGVRGESFDRATCRGALMFMPDPTGALSSLHEALRPGGRAVVTTLGPPQRCPMLAIPAEVVARHDELAAPRPGQPGVFGVPSAGRLAGHFEEAGFTVIETATLETPGARHWTPEQYWDRISRNAGFLVLLLRSLPAEARETIRAEVMQALEDRFPDGRVSLGMEHVLAAGVKAPE